jgi:ubiquinone biosynthesis monooxygenase Coq6
MFDDWISLVWSTTPEIAKRLVSLPDDAFLSLVNAAYRLSPTDLGYLLTSPSPSDLVSEIVWRESLQTQNENTLPPRTLSLASSSRAAFPLKFAHVDEYTAPRVALIGDAAHTVHPLAGQGLNLGLGDVRSLSGTVHRSLRLGQDIGAVHALAGYPFERYAANLRIMGVCDKLHKLYSTENWGVVKLRSWGLEVVNELSAVKKFIVQRAS